MLRGVFSCHQTMRYARNRLSESPLVCELEAWAGALVTVPLWHAEIFTGTTTCFLVAFELYKCVHTVPSQPWSGASIADLSSSALRQYKRPFTLLVVKRT